MNIKNLIVQYYGEQFEPSLLDELSESARLVSFEAQQVLIEFGQQIKSMPILLEGAVKILREDYSEGELLLYFLEKGDVCAVSMSCCLGNKQSTIKAIAETDGMMLMVPIYLMDSWLAKYSSWRRFVLDSYHNRFEEMLEAIDNLAFRDMESRVKTYLLDIATINKGHSINKTHQEIANELNTSRVVISRLLKSLEIKKFLKLGRGFIELI